MDESKPDFDPLIELLEAVVSDGLSHELKKQLMLSIHKTKSACRQQKLADLTLVLLDVEDCLGFGLQAHEIELERLEALILKLTNTQLGIEPEKETPDPRLVSSESKPAAINLTVCNCASRDEAREIARGLVEKRLAACVNIIANIGAIYRWEGEILDTSECQLQIKSAPGQEEALYDFIRQNHTNEVPEILSIPINKGNQSYFDWVHKETT